MAKENLAQDLSDFLATKNFQTKFTDEKGQDTGPDQARVFAFDWVSPASGKNYGTAVIVLGEENDLQLFFGDNLGKSMENPEDKEAWFTFMKQLKDFATRHNIGTFTPLDINQLKHTMAGIAAIKEGLFEGYYGTRKISYVGAATEARLVIRHNRMLGENDKRYRYVESLFIETADGERFKLPFTKLAGGRAMLEHVRQGGNPYDIRGQHVKAIVQEMNVLSKFNRASQNRVFEGATAELVESARGYYEQLQNNLRHMATGRGYQQYFESWTPADIAGETQLVEGIKQLFVEQTIDARIEAAVPILARLQQGAKMKEIAVFENWINRLTEGTWALPDTPEAQEKLDKLLSQELIVGPDATNATENLYDVIGDDELFDILSDLARRDPRANIWDDSDVQRRLAELGIQTPQSTQAEPADVDQDQAPKQQGVAEDQLDEINWKKAAATGALALGALGAMSPAQARVTIGPDGQMTPSFAQQMQQQVATQNASGGGASGGGAGGGQQSTGYSAEYLQKVIDGKVPRPLISKEKAQQLLDTMKESVAEGQLDELSPATLKSYHKKAVDKLTTGDVPLNKHDKREAGAMKAYKKVYNQKGVAESVMLDESGETLQHILNRFKHEVQQFEQGADLDTDLYHALYDYYSDAGAMPYGIAKGRTGDPFEWVTDRLDQELGTGNYAPRMAEADAMDTFEVGVMGPAMGGQMVGVGEAAGCNMTAEGQYCPEHGLMECGAMEGVDDPINANSSITGSYYESAPDPLQRIKQLARALR